MLLMLGLPVLELAETFFKFAEQPCHLVGVRRCGRLLLHVLIAHDEKTL